MLFYLYIMFDMRYYVMTVPTSSQNHFIWYTGS